MEESINFLKKLNISNQYIILGCSGGPDSMCLLDILNKLNFRIICAHVNHNIREESTNEEKNLRSFCVNRNIVFELLSLPKTNNNEAFYRNRRYDFYKKLAKKYKTEYIMTAHHADDLMETIIMRISRGSNIKGYAGFESIYNVNEYTFIKPLIFHTKEEILTYNEKNNIVYFNDKTNKMDCYTRNRYRKYVLPFLKSENINIHKKYLQFSQELTEVNKYLENIINSELEHNFKSNILSLNEFLNLDEFIQKMELRKIFQILYEDKITKINNEHIDKILSLLKKHKNFKYSLPENIIVIREYNKLHFTHFKKHETFNYEIKNKTLLPNGDCLEMIKESNDKSNFTIKLSSEEIELPLFVRTREDGDRIFTKNLNGSQKIKDIFINEKVPSEMRKTWPVVTTSTGEVIWLPGLKKSKFDKTNNEKYDIIIKYVRKEEKNEKKSK